MCNDLSSGLGGLVALVLCLFGVAFIAFSPHGDAIPKTLYCDTLETQSYYISRLFSLLSVDSLSLHCLMPCELSAWPSLLHRVITYPFLRTYNSIYQAS